MMKVEVHGEEGHIAGDIYLPETVSEFETVIDLYLIAAEVNVFEVQVAVAVANPAIAGTLVQE